MLFGSRLYEAIGEGIAFQILEPRLDTSLGRVRKLVNLHKKTLSN